MNGFAFRDRSGREVAVAWAREEKDEGVVCSLPESASAYDMYANAMQGRSIRLTRDPVYVVGVGLAGGLAFK